MTYLLIKQRRGGQEGGGNPPNPLACLTRRMKFPYECGLFGGLVTTTKSDCAIYYTSGVFQLEATRVLVTCAALSCLRSSQFFNPVRPTVSRGNAERGALAKP